MTSCLTSASMAWMRATSKLAFERIAWAALRGTMPAADSVSVAATSTFSQVRNLLSSFQIRPISGRVYRAIKSDLRGRRGSQAEPRLRQGTPDCSGTPRRLPTPGEWEPAGWGILAVRKLLYDTRAHPLPRRHGMLD